MMLRVSNLGPRTRKMFDAEKHPVRQDLTFENDCWNLSIRWSKTIQCKNRTVKAPLIPSVLRQICPQHWVTRMKKLIPADPTEPLFLVRYKHSRCLLTSAQINRLLKKWAKSAEISHLLLTGHGIRRGSLNWAHQAQISSENLKILGDWASSAYQRYIDVDYQSRLTSAKKMAKKFSEQNM